MRVVGCVLLMVLVGCGKKAPEAPVPAPDVTAPAPVAQADVAPAPADAAAPADIAVAAADTAPAPPAEPAEPDDKTLERSPGLTPVLPLVKAPAPPAIKDLAGTPGESPAMGPNDAIVKVFLFSDFQCPVCRRAVEPMKKLVRAFPGDVQVIFKHHALPSHSQAEPAARASLAAFRQGRFWEMHDRLFENQQGLDEATLRSQAISAGCDGAKYDTDFADPAIAAQVAFESAQAQAIDAMGTPAYIINGDKTVGWGSYLGMESQVRRALDEARQMVTDGVPRAEVAKKATEKRDAAMAKVLFGP